MATPCSSMTCEIVDHDGFQHIKLNGSLSDDATATVRKLLMDLVAEGNSKLVVDLADVSYISSSGIGTLVSVLKKCTSSGVEFAVCSLGEDIKELFSLTRLDQVFTIAADLEAWKATQP